MAGMAHGIRRAASSSRSGWVLLLALYLFFPLRAHALAMEISNLSDIALGTWSMGDPAVQTTMDVCIYGLNVPTLTNYAITVSSAPSGFKFGAGTKTIPYSLYWNDAGAGNLNASLGTQLSDGVKLTLRQNPNILLTNCGGAYNARLTLKVAQADMTAALSGNYQTVLTFLLTPN